MSEWPAMGITNGLKLPESFRGQVEDILEGRTEPVPAKDAATVVVLRDHDEHGLQAFMLRRVRSMAFAPGAYVFPGGSVDPRDGEAALAWSGPSPAEWGEAFGADETLARELVCAAVRETFEETLVLLAGPTGETVVDDTRGDDWEADRQALLDRSQSFGGSSTAAASCCGPTCCARGPTGSLRRSSAGATTPGSSSPRCRRASGPGTSAPRPTRSPG